MKMEIKILFAVFLIASTLVVAESCMGSKKGQNSGGKYSSNATVVLVAKWSSCKPALFDAPAPGYAPIVYSGDLSDAW